MLYSSQELMRYDVAASDGSVGSVVDVLLNPETWQIEFLSAEAGATFDSDEVRIATGDIRALRHPDEVVDIAVSNSQLSSSGGGKEAKHLVRMSNLLEFAVLATDAHLGRFHGLMFETDDWHVRYVVVDTGELLTAKLVLLSPSAVQSIDFDTSEILINLPIETVRNSPEFDGDTDLSRQYEVFLHDYYGWQPYWDAH